VRNAAKKMVAVVVGIVTASVSKEDLSTHHHPLSKLHDAAQGIITEYRLIQGNK
jgi:hypothetical protein